MRVKCRTIAQIFIYIEKRISSYVKKKIHKDTLSKIAILESLEILPWKFWKGKNEEAQKEAWSSVRIDCIKAFRRNTHIG